MDEKLCHILSIYGSYYPPQVIYVTELLANLILGEQESLARHNY